MHTEHESSRGPGTTPGPRECRRRNSRLALPRKRPTVEGLRQQGPAGCRDGVTERGRVMRRRLFISLFGAFVLVCGVLVGQGSAATQTQTRGAVALADVQHGIAFTK